MVPSSFASGAKNREEDETLGVVAGKLRGRAHPAIEEGKGVCACVCVPERERERERKRERASERVSDKERERE